MSVYSGDFPQISDYKAVEEYIDLLNEKLKYMFNYMTPEENFSDDRLMLYKEENKQVSALEKTVDGFKSAYINFEKDTESEIILLNNKILMKVSKGDVSNQFSLEKGDVIFKGNRFHVLTDNFVIDRKNNVMMNGTIIADGGDLAGWTIKKTSSGRKYIEGGSKSRITVGKIETEETVGFKELLLLGDSDFRHADIELDGSDINTDKTTVFLDGFEARHVEAYGKVTCGAARAYKEVTCDGQITCRKCYTDKDGSSWSDVRLKKNIEKISQSEADDFFNMLRPVTWHFKADNRLSSGFIAQEVKESEEEIKQEYGLTGSAGGHMTLRYAGFIPFLVKIIQRQTREIDDICKRT